MAKSLQDQLLAAGAVDKNRATRLKKAKHKQSRQRARGAVTLDKTKASAEQAHVKKVARDRELSRLKQQQMDAKSLMAQVRQLVELNRVERIDADSEYSFTDGKIVKKLYVDEQQKKQLIEGALAITRIDDAYELVPTLIAGKIRERHPSTIILLNDGQQQSEVEDDYADYQVPDDLDW